MAKAKQSKLRKNTYKRTSIGSSRWSRPKNKTNAKTGNDIVAKENNFYFETLCEYKQPDGTRGWILTVKPKPKEEK